MNSQAASAEVNDSIRPQAKGGSVQCHCSPPVFRWEQCYGMGNGSVHWALCDSDTDAESEREGMGHRVSCGYMVLLADYPQCMDGRLLSKQYLPALIVRLLNEHYAREANGMDEGRRTQDTADTTDAL